MAKRRRKKRKPDRTSQDLHAQGQPARRDEAIDANFDPHRDAVNDPAQLEDQEHANDGSDQSESRSTKQAKKHSAKHNTSKTNTSRHGVDAVKPSTPAPSRRSESDKETVEPETADVSPPRPAKRRVRWRRFAAIVFLGLAALLYFAPSLLVRTPAITWITQRVFADVDAEVKLGAVRLSWLQPIVIHDVQIAGGEAQELLQAATIRTDRTLLQLLRSPKQLGQILISQPRIWLETRPGGSNLEDAFQSWLAPRSDQPDATLPEGRIVVEDGIITLSSSDQPPQDLENVGLTLTLPSPTQTSLALEIDCRGISPGDAEELDKQAIDGKSFHISALIPVVDSPNQELAVKAELQQFSLGLVGPVAMRFHHPVRLIGSMTGEISIEGESTTALDSVRSRLSTDEVIVQHAAWSSEQLVLPSTALTVDMEAAVNDLIVNECQFQTAAADIELSGRIQVEKLFAAQAKLIEAILQPELNVEGSIDVAALASQLPNTLHLRDDVELTSGKIDVSLTNQSQQEGPNRIAGQISASGLKALQAGRPVGLRGPVRIEFEVDAGVDHFRADKLVARSTFLSLTAVGDAERGQLKFVADAARLQRELGQFFDLSKLQMAGEYQGGLRWSTRENKWDIGGQLVGNSVRFGHPDRMRDWREPQLELRLTATGQMDGNTLAQLESGSITVQAGQDTVSADLTAAVDRPSVSATWPIDATITGELSSWRARLESLISQAIPPAEGRLLASSSLQITPASVTFQNANLSVEEAVIQLGERTLREPKLNASANGRYGINSGEFACTTLRVQAGDELRLVADNLSWPLDTMATKTTQIELEASLADAWQRINGRTASLPSGHLLTQARLSPGQSGDLRIQAAGRVSEFNWQTYAADQRRYVSQWKEPTIDYKFEADWRSQEQALDIAKAYLNTTGATVDVAGKVVDVAVNPQLELRGQSSIDFDQISKRFAGLLGPNVTIRGSSSHPLVIAGPLWNSSHSRTKLVSQRTHPSESQAMQARLGNREPSLNSQTPQGSSTGFAAEFGAGWQSAHAWGFDAGPAAIDAKFSDGQLLVAPLIVPVNGGKLVLRPALSFVGTPRLKLARGRIVQDVGIRPEMCQQWLKYVAPLLAESTSAEGRFSVEIAGADVPLLATQQMSTAGAIQIHGARVGPGPLAKQILGIAQQVRSVVRPGRGPSRLLSEDQSWVDLPEQKVGFRVENGKVAHQNLTMVFDDIEIRTRGWVTLDQQLSIVAEIPIRQEWVGQERWLAGLRGQTLKIPIRGHLQRPQIDSRALQTLTQQAVSGAAQGIIQNELERQLKKLIP